MAAENLYVDETPTRETHACAFCEQHIDGDEVLRRHERHGWLPYHPACAPDVEAGFCFGIHVFGGTRSYDSGSRNQFHPMQWRPPKIL